MKIIAMVRKTRPVYLYQRSKMLLSAILITLTSLLLLPVKVENTEGSLIKTEEPIELRNNCYVAQKIPTGIRHGNS